MCGKAAVSHLSWAEIYAYASSLTPPAALPPDPESRVNISPSRLRRKSEPDSMVWETLPVIYRSEHDDSPAEAIWPFIPAYSEGYLPTNKDGRLISTANARFRNEPRPFAPTFMGAWSAQFRVLTLVSWIYVHLLLVLMEYSYKAIAKQWQLPSKIENIRMKCGINN